MLPVEWGLLLLILVANGTPVLVTRLCGDWGGRPLDGGWILADGRRLLGDAKTWRGLLAAMLATGLGAVLLHWPIGVGIIIGLAAMLGDVLSSFIKRRLGLDSSSQSVGLDQIPEALLPLLAVAETFALGGLTIAMIVVGFAVLELTLSPLFYWLGIRNRPY
ncbi:MAG: CDP-archaeol synthase [Candidatus Competibacteraceae bacterium]|nr:CDP-archaeol synthase [Candidatus Competibacteraceae bacterium]MCP5127183.1 CDP-archaeol synthase [Gammaproteobacteria bacterium]